MKKTLLLFILILILLGGGFYFTNKSHAPTIENQEEVAQEGIKEENFGEPLRTFEIDREESTAEFQIDEVLRDEDFRVVGSTSEISGDISLFEDENENPFLVISDILVRATDFKTDSENRDRAISNFILRSKNNEEFEFIKFTPNSRKISIEKGKEVNVEIPGRLSISGATEDVVFSGTINLGENLLVDISANIKRSDFDLKIPSVPFVASVEDGLLISAKILAK